jgi:hypothetical protein
MTTVICVTTSFFDTAQTGYWGFPGPFDFTYDNTCTPGQVIDLSPVVAPLVPPIGPPPMILPLPPIVIPVVSVPSSPMSPPVSAVPEPSSAWLLGIAFAVFVLWRLVRKFAGDDEYWVHGELPLWEKDDAGAVYRAQAAKAEARDGRS